MRAGWRLYAYLLVLFLLLSIFCYRQYAGSPVLLLAEAVLVVLAALGVLLLRQVLEPIKQLHQATQLLREEAFTMRVREVGHREMDQLIDIYNTMAERLRQERVHNQEQKFLMEKVLDVTRTAIIGFDYDGNIENLNPAAEQLFGMSRQDMMGKSLARLNHPLADVLDQLAVTETQIVSHQGRRKLECEHMYFVDRGFYKSFMFINELTEVLRQTEKQAYGKLIRIMSHEINNSLGAANSLLHSLGHYRKQLAEEDQEDYQTALDVVISRTEHLQAFMNDYSSVVKLPQPNPEPVDPAALLKQIRVLMNAELERRSITWEEKLQTPVRALNMDRNQMEQVLLNIIKNAMEAIGENGLIRLTTKTSEGRLQLIITDNGSGISPEIAASLFTPFTTTKKDGQGIGLTMIAEILTNHGFDYALESDDHQTHFTIWF